MHFQQVRTGEGGGSNLAPRRTRRNAHRLLVCPDMNFRRKGLSRCENLAKGGMDGEGFLKAEDREDSSMVVR